MMMLISAGTFLHPDESTGASSAFTNKLGIRFIYAKPGMFIMGSPEEESGHEWDEKQHEVNITEGFYISVTEITQGQYEKLMGVNPSAFKACGNNCPVDTVSWNDCQEFLKKLNHLENTSQYRLPTEAEWEYACRAGSQSAFTVGDVSEKNCEFSKLLDMVAWYCGNSGKAENVIYDLKPHGVGVKKPNAWGIYDMHGNVQEWCLDQCGWRNWTGLPGVMTETYKDGAVNPLSSEGKNCVIRGGSWNAKIDRLRSAERTSYKPVAKKNNLGFRIVKTTK
ncbi:MAG: formylglycine-generating enzyme family protein [Proteobacteria bacterium]|nr:formylglycine-generating enzyme family protein [Pseudomonadota bacterium]